MALSANERRIVELVLKATGDAELKRMTAELRATREAAQGSQKALGGMSQSLAVGSTFVKGFIAQFSVSTIISWTRAIFEAADALDAAAEQAGIGVERYQTLKEAFRVLEVDAKKFEAGMERLATTLSDTLAGDTGKAVDALKELGVASKIYSGEIRTTEELVDALAQSQQAMGDDMKFTSLIVDILGKKLGVDFANALKDGKLATEEMSLATEGFNVVTAEQIKKLADANEAVDHFSTEAKNALIIWAAEAIKAFERAGDAWDDFNRRRAAGDGFLDAIRGASYEAARRTRDDQIQSRIDAATGGAAALGRLFDEVDRTPVAPPRSTARSGGSSGETPAQKAAREKLAAENKKIEDQLQRQFDLQRKLIAEEDAAGKAVQDWANAINGAADPLIDLNAEMDKLIANQGKLSDAGFEYEFNRITAAINEAQNAMAENSQEWAAHQKTLEAHAKAAEEIRAAWEYTAEAFAQATYDIISGSMKIGQAVKKMVASILSEVARIAAVKLAAQIVGALFGATGVGKAAGTGGTGAPKLFASGGVVNGPTAFVTNGGIGIAGEAGPEMIAPLRRDSAGRMGVGAVAPKVVVNNYAGADVGVTQTSDGVQIDIIRRAIANDIRRGGNPVSSAIEGAYRVGRSAQAFG